MDNITKIKLINSLIDAVSHFYDLKQKGQDTNQKHLKGFCEGMAYTLVQIDAIDAEEAKRILQGLGKHREVNKEKEEKVQPKEQELDPNDLEIPTVFRKEKKL
jgi:soluble cytochrome b562